MQGRSSDVAGSPAAAVSPELTYVRDQERAAVAELVLGRVGEVRIALDRLAQLICTWTGADHSAVCLVEDDAVSAIASSAPPGSATRGVLDDVPVERSLCARIVEDGPVLHAGSDVLRAIAPDAAARFGGYLGAPLEVLGCRVGTVCALSGNSRTWSDADERALREIAAVVETTLAPGGAVPPADPAADRLPLTGVLRFDRDLRVVLAEGWYARPNGGRLPDLLPGGVWRDVEAHVSGALSGQPAGFSCSTPLGRFEVELEPQVDGGDVDGVVATYRVHAVAPSRAPRDLVALGQAESVEDALLELVDDGVLVTDAEGSILRRNARARDFEPTGGIERLDDWRDHTMVLDADGHWLPPSEHPTAVALRTGRSQLDVELIVVSRAGRRRMRVSAFVLAGPETRLVTVLHDLTELQRTHGTQDRDAGLDQLTKLITRPALEERLGDALMLARARRRHLALLLCDIRGLRHFNDAFGSDRGDDLLRLCAERISGVPGAGLVSRVGGDDFAVVAEVADEAEAMRLAERLCVAVDSPVVVDDATYVPRLAVGVALARSGVPVVPLLNDAEMALADAKAADGDTVVVASEERRRAVTERRQAERDLRAALAAGDQLELHYQPMVRGGSRRTTEFEALVRWRHPDWGLLAPARFIGLAESTGLIGALGDWVLEEACRQAAAWSQPDGAGPRIHVNLAASQFTDLSLPTRLEGMLREHRLPPDAIGLEVTESQLMLDERPLQRLRAMGLRIALDDFGTGYSSMSRLQDLPIDVLKVDRAFVSSARAMGRKHALLESIATMGRGLGLEIVAEGVETEDQARAAERVGCNLLQGFLLGRPAPADQWPAAPDARRTHRRR